MGFVIANSKLPVLEKQLIKKLVGLEIARQVIADPQIILTNKTEVLNALQTEFINLRTDPLATSISVPNFDLKVGQNNTTKTEVFNVFQLASDKIDLLSLQSDINSKNTELATLQASQMTSQDIINTLNADIINNLSLTTILTNLGNNLTIKTNTASKITIIQNDITRLNIQKTNNTIGIL